MEKYKFTLPVISGATKPIDIHNEEGKVRGRVKRFYPHIWNKAFEIMRPGWEVNIKANEDEKEITIKEHFRWLRNEWSLYENDRFVGYLKDIKIIEFGNTQELDYHGRKYYFIGKSMETKTSIFDEQDNLIAKIDYDYSKFGGQKELYLYSNELPVTLIVSIDYISALKKR